MTTIMVMDITRRREEAVRVVMVETVTLEISVHAISEDERRL